MSGRTPTRVASEDDKVDIDLFQTFDRVAGHLPDRGLAPGETIPSGDALTHYTVRAAGNPKGRSATYLD